MAGSRPARIAERIRDEVSSALLREVKDPGVGFVTITGVRVTPDLQIARVYYTALGDAAARRATDRALRRAMPFLRRHVATRLGLRRAPELVFHYDDSVERTERIEQLLDEVRSEAPVPDPTTTDDSDPDRS